jgi:Domain of unknown function (DUF4265)
MIADHNISQPEQGLVKVIFDLSKDNGPNATESLWAERVGDSTFRLRNVPVFAYGFSEQDVVKVEERDGSLFVTGAEARGGHSTYRIYLPTDTTDEKFALDWKPLENLGCTYERANRRIIAIDVPPSADVYAVYAVLENGEKDGRWEFEEGYCGHPLRPQTPLAPD